MRFADARLNASSISSSSIRLSFVGVDVDWMTKTSPPRTFSVISTCTSPSLKRPISAPPSGTPRWALIASARGRFEFPVNSLISPFTERAAPPCPRVGREGVEPSLPDPKSGALPAWLPPKPPSSARDRPLRKRRRVVFGPFEVNTMRHRLARHRRMPEHRDDAACTGRIRRLERERRATRAGPAFGAPAGRRRSLWTGRRPCDTDRPPLPPHAPVVKWISHRPPEPGVEVRFLSGALRGAEGPTACFLGNRLFNSGILATT